MKHGDRLEKARSRREPKRPASVSRNEARGTLDRLVARLDARHPDRKTGAGFRAGGLVRGLRREAGLTQGDLAKRIGVSQARISELEAGLGSQGPTWDLMERIATACGRTIGVLPSTHGWGELAGYKSTEDVEIALSAAGEYDSEGRLAESPAVHELQLNELGAPAWAEQVQPAASVGRGRRHSRVASLTDD